MTTPARSPIADAAAAAQLAWRTSEARRQEVIAKARAALAPVLPGVPLPALQTSVEDGDLVIVTDGVVTVGVRADATVWLMETNGPGWRAVRQVRNGRELAEVIPPHLMRGRAGA